MAWALSQNPRHNTPLYLHRPSVPVRVNSSPCDLTLCVAVSSHTSLYTENLYHSECNLLCVLPPLWMITTFCTAFRVFPPGVSLFVYYHLRVNPHPSLHLKLPQGSCLISGSQVEGGRVALVALEEKSAQSFSSQGRLWEFREQRAEQASATTGRIVEQAEFTGGEISAAIVIESCSSTKHNTSSDCWLR